MESADARATRHRNHEHAAALEHRARQHRSGKRPWAPFPGSIACKDDPANTPQKYDDHGVGHASHDEILGEHDTHDAYASYNNLNIIYIDELNMPKRPQVDADIRDREVFLKVLPPHVDSEEQLQAWIEKDFGDLDRVKLIRASDSSSDSLRAYVRFTSHENAALYIEAEGDEAAAWSESERAIKRASSVYGADIHKAFAGLDSQVFPWILAGCSVDKLWMQSEVQWPQGSSVPKPAGRELHFAVDCDAQELIKVQDALAEVLQGFHEQVSRQLKRATARW